MIFQACSNVCSSRHIVFQRDFLCTKVGILVQTCNSRTPSDVADRCTKRRSVVIYSAHERTLHSITVLPARMTDRAARFLLVSNAVGVHHRYAYSIMPVLFQSMWGSSGGICSSRLSCKRLFFYPDELSGSEIATTGVQGRSGARLPRAVAF